MTKFKCYATATTDRNTKCKRCSCDIKVVPNSKYCPTCKDIVRAETQIKAKAQTKKNMEIYRQTRAEITKYELAKKKNLITDKEQLKINKAVDDKHVIPCKVKKYKRGSTEFKQIAASIVNKNIVGSKNLYNNTVDFRQYFGLR